MKLFTHFSLTKLVILTVVAATAVQVLPVQAATYAVTKVADTNDGNCSSSDCSLREAVAAANNTSDQDTIIFDVSGTFTLSTTIRVIYGVEIQGNGPGRTIISGSGNYANRVFTLDDTSHVGQQFKFSQLTITNGSVHGSGGGIYQAVDGNRLVISNVAVTNNYIQNNNNTAAFGAGVYSVGGLVIENSTFSNNTIKTGSSMQNTSGTAVAIDKSNQGNVNITNSTFYNNSGESSGGAISVLTNFNGVFAAYNITVNNNQANTVELGAGTTSGGIVNQSTVNIYIFGSILAGNFNLHSSEKNCAQVSTGAIVSAGYNIDGGSTCLFTNTGDQKNVTASQLKLVTLANNGGSTQTQALGYGSVAINTSSAYVSVDQRGIVRPQQGGYDIGAYEFKDDDNDHSPYGTDCDDTNASVYANGTFYQDADGDGLGNSKVSIVTCAVSVSGYVTNSGDNNDQDADNDGVAMSSDCDDHNATITSSPQTYYEDADADGQGNANSAVVSCTQPSGYVTNSSDTDDTVSNGGTSTGPTDTDKDGLTSDQDCNDGDATITYKRTYYKDGDSDSVGGSTTTVLCSSTAPSGYVTITGDCDDADATVTSYQTYYADADGDGQGNASVSTSVCSSAAPTGYTTTSTDTDDTVDSSLIELPDDGISNDGDADVDEANTVAENGIYSTYGSTDPTDPDAYASSISSIKGKKNGKIKVVFADGVKYSYPIFDIDSDTKIKVKQYHNSGYLVVLNPVGKKIALVNPYTGAVINTLSIQTSTTYSKNSLKQGNLRPDTDNSYEMVVTSLQDTAMRLSIIKVNIKKLKLSLKDTLTATLNNVDVGETQVMEPTTIIVRTAEETTIKQYQVNSDYTFQD